MSDPAAMEKVIARVGDLPAMPALVAHVLRITEDPKTAMSEVSAAIEPDPAMTAKILRVSNSSYYGMRQVVGNLKLALVILGVREVRNIVLGIGVFEAIKGGKEAGEAFQKIWDRSLLIAGLAKRMNTTMGLGIQGEEFVAGLLSDIGRLVMLNQAPDEYGPVYAEYGAAPEVLCDHELAGFGYTHADVAAALAQKWNLPPVLTDALWHQYPHPARPLKSAKDPKVAAVVRLAKAAAYDDFAGRTRMISPVSQEAWELLDAAKNPVPANQREDFVAKCLKDFEAMPSLPL